jgi:hypothetical protein
MANIIVTRVLLIFLSIVICLNVYFKIQQGWKIENKDCSQLHAKCSILQHCLSLKGLKIIFPLFTTNVLLGQTISKEKR